MREKTTRPVEQFDEADFEECTVKYFGAKEFGFLTRSDGTDGFFHLNQVDDEDKDLIKQGLAVEAVFRDGPKGPVAKIVRIP